MSSRKRSSSSKNTNNSVLIKVCNEPGPIVCSFPSGLPDSLNNGDYADQPKFTIKESNGGRQSYIVGKDDTCTYSALVPKLENTETNKKEKKRNENTATAASSANSLDNSSARTTKLYVGIYDKINGTLTLQKAAADGYVFALSQSVNTYQPSTSVNVGSDRNMTLAESSRALVEDFGSAKKRKVMKSREVNKVNVESVIGAGSAMVDNIVKGESMSASNRAAIERRLNESEQKFAENTAADEWRQRFLPNYNRKADKVYNVYDAKDMAGESAWRACEHIVRACMKKGDVAEALVGDNNKGNWMPVIVAIMKKFPQKSPDTKEFFTKVSLFQYWTLLYTKFHMKRSFQGPDDDNMWFHGVPSDVGRRFVSLFATEITAPDGSIGYVMSKANKDRCCMHLLLMLLMVDKWNEMKSDNVKTFAETIKLDVKEASQLLRLAGCTVVSRSPSIKNGSIKVVATLTMPLTFPAMKKRGQKKAS